MSVMVLIKRKSRLQERLILVVNQKESVSEGSEEIMRIEKAEQLSTLIKKRKQGGEFNLVFTDEEKLGWNTYKYFVVFFREKSNSEFIFRWQDIGKEMEV